MDRSKPDVARFWPGRPRDPTGLLIVALLLVAACAQGRRVASPSPTPLEEDVPSVDRFLPPTYEEGGKVVMPVTFPDGTTAEILYPPELDLAGMNIQPYTSAGGPAGVGRDFTIVYGQAEEVLRGWGEAKLLAEYSDGNGGTVGFWRLPDVDYLAFQFGSWTVLVYDYHETGARMSDEQRSLWATHLHGEETSGGWLLLTADPPLSLAKAGEHAGPQLDFWFPGAVKGVLLFAGRCTPIRAGEGFQESDIEVVDDLAVARTRDVDGQRYAIWCDPRVPIRVDVYAGRDETLIDALVAGLEIRSGPPDGPGSEDLVDMCGRR